jgi:hypothetical protein
VTVDEKRKESSEMIHGKESNRKRESVRKRQMASGWREFMEAMRNVQKSIKGKNRKSRAGLYEDGRSGPKVG